MRRHLFVHLFGDVLALHGCTKLILAAEAKSLPLQADESVKFLVAEGGSPVPRKHDIHSGNDCYIANWNMAQSKVREFSH